MALEMIVLSALGALGWAAAVWLWFGGRGHVARIEEWRERCGTAQASLAGLEARVQGHDAEKSTLLRQVDAERAEKLRLDEQRREAADQAAEARAAKARAAQALEGLAGEKAGVEERLATLEAKLEEQASALKAEANKCTELEGQLRQAKALGEKERDSQNERIAFLEAWEERMKRDFRELSGRAIKEQNEDFKKVAFERVEQLVTPLKENIGTFQKEMRDAREKTSAEHSALKNELDGLHKRSAEMSEQALNLTRALKGDRQQQGAWGEMVLETLLERSGLIRGEQYEVQDARRDEDGNQLRPDVVVRLLNDRELVIDSKVSLKAYEEAVSAEDEAARDAALRRHVASIKAHYTALGSKDYARHVAGEGDYVMMFIPIEGALSEALRVDGRLTEHAFDRGVTIATPTTLMMALRTIKNVWDIETRTANAEEIAARAGKLYDKAVGFVSEMQKVGDALGKARNSYDKALGQLSDGSGSLVRQTQMLKDLGAKGSRDKKGVEKSFPTELLERSEGLGPDDEEIEDLMERAEARARIEAAE